MRAGNKKLIKSKVKFSHSPAPTPMNFLKGRQKIWWMKTLAN